jgi:hypothetical protein
MSEFSDLKTTIAEWANRQDWSDTLVTSFIRMAEQKFNAELRVDRMITWVSGITASRCAALPDDWQESDMVKIANAAGPSGFLPIRYKSRDEFFSLVDADAYGYYTYEGRTIFFGGPPNAVNGVEYRLTYFANVPVISDSQDSWVYEQYPNLYLFGSLMHADLHAIGEEQTAAGLKQLTEDMIQKLNQNYQLSKASGSRITRSKVRSFG